MFDDLGAGIGNVEVVITDIHGHKDSVKPRVSKSSETTYYVEYMVKEEGRYSIHIYFAGKEIPESPYTIMVGAGKLYICHPVFDLSLI